MKCPDKDFERQEMSAQQPGMTVEWLEASSKRQETRLKRVEMNPAQEEMGLKRQGLSVDPGEWEQGRADRATQDAGTQLYAEPTRFLRSARTVS